LKDIEGDISLLLARRALMSEKSESLHPITIVSVTDNAGKSALAMVNNAKSDFSSSQAGPYSNSGRPGRHPSAARTFEVLVQTLVSIKAAARTFDLRLQPPSSNKLMAATAPHSSPASPPIQGA